MVAAQISLSEEEIPNDLFPTINSNGTHAPITGPAIYHGHGCFRNCMNEFNILKLIYKFRSTLFVILSVSVVKNNHKDTKNT